MPARTAYTGSVNYVQILNEKGAADKRLEKKLGLSKQQLLGMYRALITTRVLDDRALKLQRQGRMLTYAPCQGEEAISVGSAFALNKDDWVVPAYREQGMYVAMGVPLKFLLMYFMGFEEGNALPREFNITPICVPVATHFPHAAGIGMALNYLGDKKVVMAYTGDGGTSEGDFYEALNFAGVFNAPVVFIVRNNQWAISVPRKKQTAAETLAQKGIAAGINCVQVDGNDVLGVYYVAREAVARARAGKGPTLIEAVSYRMGLHTTADDPTRYVDPKERDAWVPKDPIARFAKYLKAKRILTTAIERETLANAEDMVERAVQEAESYKTHWERMFEYVYADMPEELREQRDYLKGLER
ncbi:MAG: pyruvate dehydrogenase (acetyl-transferring) E1 component subunit alpha [Candidatus Micrarchaeota archaeon]|nr:pyruvate dehydrogenase (acetyl-transferring) E1 component subunit alpha [Candidatus Micrarchaeota archaeon]